MTNPLNTLAIVMMLSFPALLQAQTIYKWQDENGKWQFSDTPPADNSRPVEQPTLDPVNTTTNTNEAMNRVFPGETAAETRYENEQDQARAQRNASVAKWCNQLRKRLSIIEGKVVFLDQQGRAMEITETEREARAVALRQKITKNCP